MAEGRRQNVNATEDEVAVAVLRRAYGDKIADTFVRRLAKGRGTPQ